MNWHVPALRARRRVLHNISLARTNHTSEHVWAGAKCVAREERETQTGVAIHGGRNLLSRLEIYLKMRCV